MKDIFSLIKWDENINEAPTEDVLIIYRDDSGDHTNYYTQVAWRVADDIWISNDGRICCNNIVCWANFPVYEDVKVFK